MELYYIIFFFFFFFNDTATTEIYTLSLHDALPIDPGIAVQYRVLLGPEALEVEKRPVLEARLRRYRLAECRGDRILRCAPPGVARLVVAEEGPSAEAGEDDADREGEPDQRDGARVDVARLVPGRRHASIPSDGS